MMQDITSTQDVTTPMILHAADSQISKDFTYRKEYPAVQLTTNLSDKNWTHGDLPIICFDKNKSGTNIVFVIVENNKQICCVTLL